jgi:hypothetical protein
MRSEDLIRTLASEAKPVRRLAHPARRVVYWLSISLLYVTAIVLFMGPRPDIGVKLGEPRFVLEIGAAFLTGVMAAMAAFCAGSPGRPLWERFAPLPMLVLWLGSLGEGCWQGWGANGLPLRPDLVCFPSIVMAGLIPGALILYMVRRGAPLAPVLTTALAALAASALGAAALRLYHTQDASIMILVWQFGSVAVITGLGGLIGRKLLRWPERRVAGSVSG